MRKLLTMASIAIVPSTGMRILFLNAVGSRYSRFSLFFLYISMHSFQGDSYRMVVGEVCLDLGNEHYKHSKVYVFL